jgi:hypothetical protein
VREQAVHPLGAGRELRVVVVVDVARRPSWKAGGPKSAAILAAASRRPESMTPSESRMWRLATCTMAAGGDEGR